MHALAQRHDLIRIWVEADEVGPLNRDAASAKRLGRPAKTRIALLKRLVGRQALDMPLLAISGRIITTITFQMAG